jgi:SAM-dependent methyltransferase
MSDDHSHDPYDAYYFAHCCGRPYKRDDEWLHFFGIIAQRMIDYLHPGRVLDAGCAMGFLVEAFRDRGIDAYGIDISEYAIKNVREDMKPFCKQASILEPLSTDYDLITCIEVFEHPYPHAMEFRLLATSVDIAITFYSRPRHLIIGNLHILTFNLPNTGQNCLLPNPSIAILNSMLRSSLLGLFSSVGKILEFPGLLKAMNANSGFCGKKMLIYGHSLLSINGS